MSGTKKITVPQIVFSILCGIVFGFVMEKGKLLLPDVIYAQFTWNNFVMLKAFLTACASSILAFAFLVKSGLVERSPKHKIDLGGGFFGGYGGNLVGGSLVGIGMVVAGSCPGTVYVQLGAGIPFAIWVLLGGFAGAALYGFFIGTCHSSGLSNVSKASPGGKAEDMLGLSYMVLVAAFSGMMACIVLLLEYLVPWKADASVFVSNPTIDSMALLSLYQRAWPPVATGMVMGALQIPMMLLTHNAVGASSVFSTLWGAIITRTGVSSLQKFADKAHNWPQVAFAVGAILGAFLSVSLSGLSYTAADVSDNFYPLRSFLGGMILVFGSRFSHGCTSGHGISGMGQLSTSSLISTAALFMSALATGLLVL